MRSGPWRGMAVRRRPTDVDHMLGWVVAEARSRGLDGRLNAALMRHVKEIEAGARSRGLANLDEVEDFRRSIHGETIGAPA